MPSKITAIIIPWLWGSYKSVFPRESTRWADGDMAWVNVKASGGSEQPCLRWAEELWPSTDQEAPMSLWAVNLWLDCLTLVSQNVLQKGSSCWLFSFFLMLERKPEPAVHEHTQLSPQPDKELRRWIGEGCFIKFIIFPSLAWHQILSWIWFLLSSILTQIMWSKKQQEHFIHKSI